MKKAGLLFILIISSLFSMAQDDTYNTKGRTARLSSDTMTVDVLVIPASKKLYSSFFDRQMTKENNIDTKTLVDTTLATLASQVAKAFNESVPAGVIPESKTGFSQDMNFVYESFEYKYELLPEPEKEETTLNKWKKKLPKKEAKPEPRRGTYMEGGQIMSNPETRARYTNIEILNSDFLFILNKKYSATTFVFINHYEMVIPSNVSQIDIQSDNYPRLLKVHYSVVNLKGEIIHSGLVTQNSSSFDNKLDYLFENSFLQLGYQIKLELEKSL